MGGDPKKNEMTLLELVTAANELCDALPAGGTEVERNYYAQQPLRRLRSALRNFRPDRIASMAALRCRFWGRCNSADADALRAKHEDMDGEEFRLDAILSRRVCEGESVEFYLTDSCAVPAYPDCTRPMMHEVIRTILAPADRAMGGE